MAVVRQALPSGMERRAEALLHHDLGLHHLPDDARLCTHARAREGVEDWRLVARRLAGRRAVRHDDLQEQICLELLRGMQLPAPYHLMLTNRIIPVLLRVLTDTRINVRHTAASPAPPDFRAHGH